MKVYWRERRAGQRLLLSLDDDTEVEVGAVRRTSQGYDALAKTNTYDPGRARKGFATMAEAKSFVEDFHPWDLFGGDWEMDVDPEVRPNPAEPPTPPAGGSGEANRPADPATLGENDPVGPGGQEEHTEKRGWKFWKKN